MQHKDSGYAWVGKTCKFLFLGLKTLAVTPPITRLAKKIAQIIFLYGKFEKEVSVRDLVKLTIEEIKSISFLVTFN